MNKLKSLIKKHYVRITAFLAVVLIVFMIPGLTEAQYVWTLNGFNTLVAGSYYFTSNYLQEGGYSHTIKGWDGKAVKSANITIRNYENALLCNAQGQDVVYNMTYSLEAHSALHPDVTTAYDYGYELVTSKNSGTTTTAYKGDYSGTITSDGTPHLDTYTFMISYSQGRGSYTLETGDYLILTANAQNSATNQFYRSLGATIKYVVSEDTQFIILEVGDSDSSAKMDFDIKTQEVPSMTSTTETVYVWYDTALFSIDQFGQDYASVVAEGNNSVSTETVGGKTFGILRMSLAANSIRQFDFTKLTATGENGKYAVYSELNADQKSYKLVAENSQYKDGSGNPSSYAIGYYVKAQTDTGTE